MNYIINRMSTTTLRNIPECFGKIRRAFPLEDGCYMTIGELVLTCFAARAIVVEFIDVFSPMANCRLCRRIVIELWLKANKKKSSVHHVTQISQTVLGNIEVLCSMMKCQLCCRMLSNVGLKG